MAYTAIKQSHSPYLIGRSTCEDQGYSYSPGSSLCWSWHTARAKQVKSTADVKQHFDIQHRSFPLLLKARVVIAQSARLCNVSPKRQNRAEFQRRCALTH